MAIFNPKRKRGKRSEWIYQFAQCLDEDGVVWIDDVAEYTDKPLGTIRSKVNALAEQYGEQGLYDLITGASFDQYSGRTCVGFEEREKERKRKNRGTKDADLAQLMFLAEQVRKERESTKLENVESESVSA